MDSEAPLSFDLANPQFWVAVAQIILIDILLSGDNAVVIALACRNLPERQRRLGIIWGVGGAIALRVTLTFFAVSLLTLPWVKLVGAVLLLWIGVKLIAPEDDADGHEIEAASNLFGAIRTVIIADFVMSLDNVLAVAAAARDSMFLLVFGLALSIPLMVWASRLILRLMDRYPAIILLGGALLGWIALSMAISDPLVKGILEPYKIWLGWTAPAFGALLVVAAGKIIVARRPPAEKQVVDLARDDSNN
jgi:YjbE family integral membrane protein